MGEQSAIIKIEAEVAKLNGKVERVEALLEEARAAGDKEEMAALRTDKKQLADEIKLLLKEKVELRKTERVMLRRSQKGERLNALLTRHH